jgi:heparosan-N-sulfate-glucuronate 5-epimerase
MRTLKELIVLSKDLLKYISGKDYSRQPQPLGKYFNDPRCYYNDLRGKAFLEEMAFIDGVPAIKFASTAELHSFPIDIFLYGLGSLDRYFFDKDSSVLNNVEDVARWIINHILATGAFDNKWKEISPHQEFFSNNSGMGQGLALSFAIRVVKYDLCNQSIRDGLSGVIERIKNNMLLPVQNGGTRFDMENGISFMEFPRMDGNIVLNGWIFAVFGLCDYLNFKKDHQVKETFDLTVKTMGDMLPEYHLPNGWALYDNMHRSCSPFYQDLHIVLLEAMYEITKFEHFRLYSQKASKANTTVNRFYFTITKIIEKMFRDKEAYTSI